MEGESAFSQSRLQVQQYSLLREKGNAEQQQMQQQKISTL
jgi:hypothetical protein